MKARVGIDDLAVYGGSYVIEAREIARARGTPERQIDNLSLRRRSVTPSFEDPVTLAVNAARSLAGATDADRYSLLIVATESGVDYAKPLSSYVHKYLGLTQHCRHFEVKHACYGATAALRMAAAWVECHPEERALVIATDMARKLFHDPAEPAEGAGAVAMAITTDPKVLRLDGPSGVATREVYDVMRPTPTKEIGHPSLSLSAYLDLFEIAWTSYAQAAGPRAFDDLAHVIYHCPLVPLVRQAHTLLVEENRSDATAEDVAASFDRLVRPSFGYCQELGNVYSGCLYVALAGLIDAVPAFADGARIGLYSYGSGSCAEFFSGVVAPEAKATLLRQELALQIARRTSLDVAHYEALVEAAERSLTEAEFTPHRHESTAHWESHYRGRGRLVLDGVRDFYRSYSWS